MNYEHFKLAAAVADDAILYGACRCFCHRIRHIRRRLYQDFMAEPGASTALFPKMVRSLIPSAQSGTIKKRATPPANQAARIHCFPCWRPRTGDGAQSRCSCGEFHSREIIAIETS